MQYASRRSFLGRWLAGAIPIFWLLLFFLVPFLVVFKISFSEAVIAQPPYLPIFSFEDGSLLAKLNFANYLWILEDRLYFDSFVSSLKIATISTCLALLLGYPMAYVIARAHPSRRNFLLLLIILPFWTSFLLRVYAWIGFLNTNGVINNVLLSLGIITEPLEIFRTDAAVYVGIVYSYLPFMILPIYATLTKLENDLLEASADLGAKPFHTFVNVTLPLSVPGVVAGSMLVFIPAVGEYVIPTLLGGSDTLMIGRVIWNEFFSNRDWPVASAVAVVMLVFVVAPIMWLRSQQVVQKESV